MAWTAQEFRYFWQEQEILFSAASTPILSPKEPRVQLVPGVKRAGLEAEHASL
jgi:hypothetical protein